MTAVFLFLGAMLADSAIAAGDAPVKAHLNLQSSLLVNVVAVAQVPAATAAATTQQSAAPNIAQASATPDTTKDNANANAPKMPKWIEEGIEKFGAITVFVAFVVSGIGLHLSEE